MKVPSRAKKKKKKECRGRGRKEKNLFLPEDILLKRFSGHLKRQMKNAKMHKIQTNKKDVTYQKGNEQTK